jgi:TetR/AcrR family transcriptional regulator, transcriptional repressor for nem operon
VKKNWAVLFILPFRNNNFKKKDRLVYFGYKTMGKKEHTRQFIIEKAAIIFNQKGYAGTSIKDITEAAQLSKGGFYGNFRSKEEIAIEAFEYSVNTVTQKARERSLTKVKSYDKLIESIQFYREYIFNEPVEGGCPILNMAPEVDDTNPEMRSRVTKALDNWQYSVKRVVEKGIENGEIHHYANAEAFATLFVAMLEGGIMMSRVYKNPKHLHIVLDQLEKMVRTELICNY